MVMEAAESCLFKHGAVYASRATWSVSRLLQYEGNCANAAMMRHNNTSAVESVQASRWELGQSV